MTVEPLVVLSVGETPTTQFVSWRLSLTNTFLVQVSEYIAADGVVSWKSNKYGSNFYKPNLFAKDLESLNKLVFDERGTPKYRVDILLLAANSKQQYLELTRSVKRYVSQKTLIIVDCNFGVSLDELVLQQLEGINHSGVLSLLADIECRKLSSGSYVLVSEMCKLFFGLTYSKSKFSNEQIKKLQEHNTDLIRVQYADTGSVLNFLIQAIVSTGINNVHKVSVDSNQMPVKVWYYTIPKIAFNALSIVFEDPYYELFTDPKDFPRSLSEDIIKELMVIAYEHSGEILSNFCIPPDETSETRRRPLVNSISYQKVFDVVKNKSKELNTFTISEAPEYLTLSFETYSFFHKIDYPAAVLLSHTLELAAVYKLPKLGLKFLFGFYSKLSLLAGMPLSNNAGRKTKDSFLFGRNFFNGAMSKTQSNDSSNFSDFKSSMNNQSELYAESKAKMSKHRCNCQANLTKPLNNPKVQNANSYSGGKVENPLYSAPDDKERYVCEGLFDLYADVADYNLDHNETSLKNSRLEVENKNNIAEVQSDYSSDDGYYSLHDYYQNTDMNNKKFQKSTSTSLAPYKKKLATPDRSEKQKEPVFFGFYLHKDPYTKEVIERYLTDVDGDDLEKALRNCHLYDDFGRYHNNLPCKNGSLANATSVVRHDASKAKMLVKMTKLCKKKAAHSHRNLSTSIKEAELSYLQGIKMSSQDPVNSGNFGHLINVSSTRFGNLEFAYQLIQKNEKQRLKCKKDLMSNRYANIKKDFKPSKQKLIEGPDSQDQGLKKNTK